MIMKYYLVEKYTARELMEAVQDLIHGGWVCQGGISVACHYSGSVFYCQAMVKGEAQ